jgi:hypothetical protein
MSQYKQLWEARLDRLDAFLVKVQADEAAAKSTKVKSQKNTKYTIKKIAAKAMNTSDNDKNNTKKQAKSEKTPKKSKLVPKATLKTNTQPQEKTHDHEPNDLQQQIGFDF